MLDQENNPELDDIWLTDDECLIRFIKSRYRIVGRVKGPGSPYVQGPRYYEEDLVVWERNHLGPRGNQLASLATTVTVCLFLSIEHKYKY